MSEQPTFEDVDQILADPTSARYHLIRDRVAYVYLTGSYPSHLTITSRLEVVSVRPPILTLI